MGLKHHPPGAVPDDIGDVFLVLADIRQALLDRIISLPRENVGIGQRQHTLHHFLHRAVENLIDLVADDEAGAGHGHQPTQRNREANANQQAVSKAERGRGGGHCAYPSRTSR